jgi:hypothetical protein
VLAVDVPGGVEGVEAAEDIVCFSWFVVSFLEVSNSVKFADPEDAMSPTLSPRHFNVVTPNPNPVQLLSATLSAQPTEQLIFKQFGFLL